MLVHNVYFSLHDNSEDAKSQLVHACHKFLSGHPGTEFFYCGKRKQELQREVNDLEFDVALNIAFADQESHDAYQKADRHFEFIEQNQANWKLVRVFDSEN
jgi:hypothetical protein